MSEILQGPYALAARVYWEAGWSNVLPVHDGAGRPGKSHVPRGYTGHEGRGVSWPDLNAWTIGQEGTHNLAVRLTAMIGIDVDAYDGRHGGQTLEKAQAELGPLPPTWSSTSRGTGASRILFFRVPVTREGALARREKAFFDAFGPNVEVLHRAHRFAVCWPSVHPDTGATYQWYGPDGALCGTPPRRTELPELPETWLDFLAPLHTENPQAGPGRGAEGGSLLFGQGGTGGAGAPDYRTEVEAARILREAVQAFIAPDADGRATRLLPALALIAGHGVPAGFWSATQASASIEAMAVECGYVKKHGLADLRLQVERGMRDGMAGPWVKVAEPAADAFASARADGAPLDAVEALLAEMIEPAELVTRRPPRHLVRGLLTLDSESWLIGAPGSKKSFVALDMAAHVALGRPWQGRRVHQGRVVMIVAEGAGGVGKRVDAWQRSHGEIGQGLLYVLPRPVQAKDVGAWSVLVEACRRIGPAMVVIDTQARVTVGLEENSATDIGVYLSAARALRVATGAGVLTVHHTGRRGADARGSSAIDGAQDTELRIDARGKDYAVLYTEKQKDVEPAEPVKLKFVKVELGVDEEGDPVNSLVLVDHDGWREGEMDGESFDAARGVQEAAVTPFAARQAPEPWTHALTAGDAGLQRWLLQALADTAEDRGLTQAEWRGLIDEKLGRSKPTATAWRKAFQRVTSSAGKFDQAVVKVHGADRWTVDATGVARLVAGIAELE